MTFSKRPKESKQSLSEFEIGYSIEEQLLDKPKLTATYLSNDAEDLTWIFIDQIFELEYFYEISKLFW